MTPDLLISQIDEARSGVEGSAYWLYPSIFWRHDVLVSQPNGSKVQIQPAYCARDLATVKLAQVLTPAGFPCVPLPGRGYPNSRNGPPGGGFTYSALVGWLKFTLPNGKILYENAGQILDIFNHGYPPALALAHALQDIQEDAAALT